MKVFYTVSTHWDREWYKPFQGFRYDLVKVTDHIIDALEKGDIDTFAFDGQTVVLEDYLEIRPENRQKITNLIKSGKLKSGPWYVMPDELLVSGESIIKNFLLGKAEAEKFGGNTWKYGYMNDIFGHIAQMPQILNGFGIKAAYLGRGMGGKNQNFKNFLWKAPDGSECIGYKDVYAQLCRNLKKASDKKEALNEYISENIDNTQNVILMYTDDHADINQNTLDFVKLAREMNFTEGPESITDYVSPINLPVEEGELTTPAQISGNFRVVTDSLSSYYPLKYENDTCENLLENKISPMLVMAKMMNIPIDLSFVNIAYKYLIKNQPHDSICGCSSDTVHNDMAYRYSQVKSICNAMESDFESKITSKGEELYFSVINYRAKKFEGVFITELCLEKNDIPEKKDNAGYQSYLDFDICDEEGNSVPYEILGICKNYYKIENPYVPVTDKYKIAMYGKLGAFGKTTFKILPRSPVKTPRFCSEGTLAAENRYISVQISPDGSVTLTDKSTNRTYSNLNTFTDDGELGNGWFSQRPVAENIIVSSVGAKTKTEIVKRSEIITVFRVTKYMSVPQSADYDKLCRSEDTTELKIVSDVILKKDSKAVEFETTVYNNAKDHRLRVEFPTQIPGSSYTSSQAFTFIKRERGISDEGINFSEPEPMEKNTDGIVCVQDNTAGLSFISKEGIHQCGVSKNGVISAVMLRSFGRMMWNNIPTEAAQIQGKHIFRYALTTETNPSELCHMKKILFETYTNTRCSDMNSQNLFELSGNISLSIIKPSENGRDIIIRLYNPGNAEQNCSLKFAIPLKYVSLVNLAEEHIQAVEFTQNTIKLNIESQKIITLSIKI